jgi:ATP-dependent RNA helicase RhlE
MSSVKDIQKLIKVDVKIVIPYPWHSGSPETASGGSTKPKKFKQKWRSS